MMKVASRLCQMVLLLSLCLTACAVAVDGFAAQNGGTTGGAGGATVTVTNGADFLTYVEEEDTPYIIEVLGTIELSDADNGRVRIQSNKTIRGIGENPTIIGSLGFKNDCYNVIIEGLDISCPKDYASEEDGISVKEDITNVFITKCTIHDCWDGCLDIARRSDWVTVSWCKFYFTTPNDNNDRVSLIGNSDGASDDLGKLHITLHHNWYGQHCMQRIPSVRYGRVHVYNNYYNCPGDIYCIWSRIQAECLIENNYFQDVYDPYVNNRDGAPVDEWGMIGASGNILDNCTGTAHPGDDDVFDPPYAYTLDDASSTPGIVQWGAGSTGQDGYPPHWYFTMYGDFDRTNFVDESDLNTFAGCWLDTVDIDDSDYYDNGIVDMAEFALFAENYLFIPPDTTAPEVPADLWALGQNAQVTLDWSDNVDEDFAGCNIYRSTVSGTYDKQTDKLNSSLLTSSDYTDTTAANGTMYYYVVTSVDAGGNESEFSVEACAVPDAVSDNILIQEKGTGFCSIDGIVDTEEHDGYTGYGYGDTTNDNGNGINWSINAALPGTYTLTWRYSNGSSDRSARLLIDDVEVVPTVDMAATGGWDVWSELSETVSLTAGIKDIRLEATNSSGCGNVDYLKVEGALPEISVCP